MKIPFSIPGYPDVIIEVSKSFWTGKPKVWVNGILAEKAGELSRAFLIPLPDGSVKKLEVDRGGIDYVPRVYVDGERFDIARRLKWYEWIFGGIPLILVFTGGALGAVCGLIGTILNYQVLRGKKSTIIKTLFILGITVLSFVMFITLVLFLQFFFLIP